MFPIINKQLLATDVKRLDIEAPDIVKRIQPGQFVLVCPEEGDERIPLTVVDCDKIKRTIALIIHEVGDTTKKLGAFSLRESIYSILGPLGMPARIEKKGTVVCVATGIGTAQMLPIARAFRQAGNKVIGIMGAKTKRDVMLEAQMRLACHRIFMTTNDGSYERRGLATDFLKTMLTQQQSPQFLHGLQELEKVDLVYAIGSVDMMRAVCHLTKDKNIPTLVQVNPIMVDCMGMCGSCRVKVSGHMVLACLDGPEFNGHQVDFDDLEIRMKVSKEWDNPESKPSLPRDESKTLAKFLSGILRK